MASVVAHTRASADRQTFEAQLAECEELARTRGWTIVEWYADRRESSAKRNRPKLDRLMADVRKGKVETFLVYRRG